MLICTFKYPSSPLGERWCTKKVETQVSSVVQISVRLWLAPAHGGAWRIGANGKVERKKNAKKKKRMLLHSKVFAVSWAHVERIVLSRCAREVNIKLVFVGKSSRLLIRGQAFFFCVSTCRSSRVRVFRYRFEAVKSGELLPTGEDVDLEQHFQNLPLQKHWLLQQEFTFTSFNDIEWLEKAMTAIRSLKDEVLTYLATRSKWIRSEEEFYIGSALLLLENGPLLKHILKLLQF